MGCQSDYQSARPDEEAAKEAAEFICYIHKQKGTTPPKWATHAAADPYGQTGEKERRDVPGALCDLLRSMTPQERDTLMYSDPRSRPRRRLADWWETHLEADAERDRKLREDRHAHDLRQSAMSKLTPEEWRALGL
jgi:hypothetical protein